MTSKIEQEGYTCDTCFTQLRFIDGGNHGVAWYCDECRIVKDVGKPEKSPSTVEKYLKKSKEKIEEGLTTKPFKNIGVESRSGKASIEGLHLDEGKLRMDLIPPEVLEALASVLTYGCNKYEERNWESGIKYNKIYGSLLRHMMEWQKGVDIDPESELPHLHHAVCNLAFLITYDARKMEELDDRQ